MYINKESNDPYKVFFPRFTDTQWPLEFSSTRIKGKSQDQYENNKNP